MKQLLVSLLCALLAAASQGKTVTVDDDGPADYSSIQAAIEDSAPGDKFTVVVRPGTYRENVSFQGRAAAVTSEDPGNPAVVRSTVISAVTGHSVSFSFREGSDSVLKGLTISGRGIYCSGASPTISKNIIRDCRYEGILGENNAAPVIEDNEIISNAGVGISGCDGPIEGNFISQNNGGIAYCNGHIRFNNISGNVNTNPGYGGGLNRCDGDIVGNAITDNHASSRGGGLYACHGKIGNNVVAGNAAGASGGGLSDCAKSVYNNTIVGNRAGEKGGGLYNCTDSVYNNIIAFNRAGSGAGIYGSCDNSYNCFAANEPNNFGGGAVAAAGDFVADPRFVIDGYWDPNGTADEGDDFWVDGAYYLKSQVGRWDTISRTWVRDDLMSYCVDAGDPNSEWTGELWPHGRRANVGAHGGTAQASMSVSEAGHLTDLNNDDYWADHNDLVLLAEKWLCDQVPLAEDLDRNGITNSVDFSILARYWRVDPVPDTPPEPNPMTWAKAPYPIPCYCTAMVATTAISTDGSGVQYYFEDYFSPSYNSGWIEFLPGEEPMWVDTGLSPDTVYWYRVKARNKANLLETGWSQRFHATTYARTKPVPNPMTWESEPNAVAPGTIRMVATTAYHDCGVEYYFECTSDPANSSGWQDSPVYEPSSLSKSVHSFVVRARDKSPYHDTTADSNEVSVDLGPPTPDPMKWAPADPAQGLPDGKPREVYHGGGTWDYWAEMRAVEAYDPCGVEYYFQCTTEGGFSSGWQDLPEYKKKVGRQGQRHIFRVKARDKSAFHNETGWSERWPALPP